MKGALSEGGLSGVRKRKHKRQSPWGAMWKFLTVVGLAYSNQSSSLTAVLIRMLICWWVRESCGLMYVSDPC